LVATSKVQVNPKKEEQKPIGYRSNLLCHCRQSTCWEGGMVFGARCDESKLPISVRDGAWVQTWERRGG